jgi:F0F1-type ATP synthase membrane subunit b/b'
MISHAYASVTSGIPPQAIYASPAFWVAVAFIIFIIIFAKPAWKFTITALDRKINQIEAQLKRQQTLEKRRKTF